VEALIVKLSMKPTRLSGWSGLARTWTMTLGMLCSPTNAAFRRKLIAGSAAGREASPPKNKPRPKHPVKVHVWAGISMRGRTGIFIFSGIMDATMYTDILETTLLPFLHDTYPDGHKFMQDNDHQIWPREPTAVQLLQKTFV
jgi:hypothetical protein